MPPKRQYTAPTTSNPEASNVDGPSPTTRPATRQTPVYPPIPPGSTARPQAQATSSASPSNGQTTTGLQNRPSRQTYHTSPSDSTTRTMGASGLVAPEIQYHTPNTYQPPGHSPTLLRPSQPRPPPPTVTPVPIPRTPSLLSNQPPADRPLQPPQSADRNIDKVVLGDLCFRTWYPSYYGKEILDIGGGAGSSSKGAGGGEAGRKDQHPVLGMLYVCPHCFKYSKELVAWGGHVRVCGRRSGIPGQEVYVHPRGTRKIQIAQPLSASGGPGKRRRGEGGVKYVEETVVDEGEWSIWEVDGEEERLFCQNLSLFAKLFLDNKSVFFDVTGFNYFLLVYTPPPRKLPSGAPDLDASPPQPQIIGFFSKEKMSWDSNNLACILIFPPWQRKGLGSLLMGASYEISKRERILGGPEKPISELGRKGYRRFWASEIARWLLGLEDGAVADIKDCSDVTWIALEDVLATLGEMDLLEDAGKGPPKPEKTPVNGHETDEAADEANEEQSQQVEVKDVPRVKVDKEAVRRYVAAQKLNLERTCDAEGFVEGYAVRKGSEDGEDENMSED